MERDNNNESVHFFLWISHGGTVSGDNILYKVNTGVNSVIFYGNNFDIIYSDILQSVIIDRNINKINAIDLLKYCATFSEEEEVEGKKIYNTYLPPLIFSTNPLSDGSSFVYPDTDTSLNNSNNTNFNNKNSGSISYVDMMGLYYFKISFDNVKQTNNIEQTKILDWNWILNTSNNVITYSQIFGQIKKYCRDVIKINSSDANVGIYACRSMSELYSNEYKLNDFTRFLSKRNKETFVNANIVNQIQPDEGVSPCIVLVENVLLNQGWKALANLKHQGCALNILSFYGILSQTYAREKATCLHISGTSIVEITNYINNFLVKRNISRKFAILRCTTNYGLSYVLDFLLSSNFNSIVTIIKMYSDLAKAGKFSNMGHTISVGIYLKYNSDNNVRKILYLLDAQQDGSKFEIDITDTSNINKNQLIENFINEYKKYYPSYNYLDIINIVDKQEQFQNIEKRLFLTPDVLNEKQKNKEIIDVINKSNLAGGNRRRIKKSKKNKLKKKGKTKKRRQKGGDGRDFYQALNEKLNRKNNVKELILSKE